MVSIGLKDSQWEHGGTRCKKDIQHFSSTVILLLIAYDMSTYDGHLFENQRKYYQSLTNKITNEKTNSNSNTQV